MSRTKMAKRINSNCKKELPSVCVLGCGNLGTHLVQALYHAGYPILQLYSRTVESATALSNLVGNAPFTTDLSKLTMSADLYICALKDSVLHEVLAKTPLRGKRIVHTAGSMPLSLLSEFTDEGGVFYPMQSFSKAKPVDFSVIPIFVEATNGEMKKLLVDMASHISKSVNLLDTEGRKQLHLAAVFASNFSNHMYAIASEQLCKLGLPFEVLLPLIDETCAKIHSLSPVEAQTGPAVRYDLNVITAQKERIDNPLQQKIYELVSQSIHEMASQNEVSQQ